MDNKSLVSSNNIMDYLPDNNLVRPQNTNSEPVPSSSSVVDDRSIANIPFPTTSSETLDFFSSLKTKFQILESKNETIFVANSDTSETSDHVNPVMKLKPEARYKKTTGKTICITELNAANKKSKKTTTTGKTTKAIFANKIPETGGLANVNSLYKEILSQQKKQAAKDETVKTNNGCTERKEWENGQGAEEEENVDEEDDEDTDNFDEDEEDEYTDMEEVYENILFPAGYFSNIVYSSTDGFSCAPGPGPGPGPSSVASNRPAEPARHFTPWKKPPRPVMPLTQDGKPYTVTDNEYWDFKITANWYNNEKGPLLTNPDKNIGSVLWLNQKPIKRRDLPNINFRGEKYIDDDDVVSY